MAIIKVDDILLNTDYIVYVKEDTKIGVWYTSIYMRNGECIELDGKKATCIYRLISEAGRS